MASRVGSPVVLPWIWPCGTATTQGHGCVDVLPLGHHLRWSEVFLPGDHVATMLSFKNWVGPWVKRYCILVYSNITVTRLQTIKKLGKAHWTYWKYSWVHVHTAGSLQVARKRSDLYCFTINGGTITAKVRAKRRRNSQCWMIFRSCWIMLGPLKA